MYFCTRARILFTLPTLNGSLSQTGILIIKIQRTLSYGVIYPPFSI
jgi:hypothetical protein